ncbi:MULTISPECIES: fasciclin domain-containing protein [unclassified Saccharicrinis]|uniref:fasciclin domain-containing protein n=1 Tax=unclassified Saccharicrinis TaxID=2646859 RepID=UPI003D336D36
MNKKILHSLLALLVIFALSACESEQWDDHYEQSDSRLNTDLLALIKADSELSTFADLLSQTGLDEVLSQNQAFTVWAPVNEAFTNVPQEILDDPERLKALIGNHISMYSFASTSKIEDGLVKVLNNKYIEYINEDGTSSFSGVDVTSNDNLCSNGILHKISDVALVRENIWSYFTNSDDFPGMKEFLTQYNVTLFDKDNSVVTGTNSLGQTVYDSVFVESNTYFDVIGNLNSEEERYSLVALTDVVYNDAYSQISSFYTHPDDDVVTTNTEQTIYNNLNFPWMDTDLMTGEYVTNTFGNMIYVDQSVLSNEVELSNGSILIPDSYTFDVNDLIYKPVRYEVEDTERRDVGSLSDFSINKKYDITASGDFTNKVMFVGESLNEDNNYFEVAFSNVLSAKYDLYIKYSPVGATKETQLKFEVTVNGPDGKTVYDIPTEVINNYSEARVKIGDTYDIPVFVDDNAKNSYYVKVKVIMDVEDAAIVLYDRMVGIDYIELVPAE